MNLDMVFKAFVGVFSAIVIIGSGLGVTTGFSQAVAADNYMESVSKIIVESNYNTNVIEKCKQEAVENGYILKVEVDDAIKAGAKAFARVELTYYFEIKLFNIKQQKIQTKIV